MSAIPFIPDNAPFSPEQRNWLNGFLAGVFANVPAVSPAGGPPRSLKIAVLYASQSGTAEGIARKVAKELKAKGHVASLTSLEGYTPATLLTERYAIFIASTYGDGEAPDAVRPFYEQLCLQHFPCCENLSFAVLALGDSNYEHFCKFGIDLDNKLASLAGTRICERVDCDVDLDESFANWKLALFDGVDDIVSGGSVQSASPSSIASRSKTSSGAEQAATPTRDNPYIAQLIEKRPLTSSISSKLTLHVAFDIGGSNVRYEAGDACGVIAQNDRQLVEEILHALNFSSTVSVPLPKGGSTTLLDALLNHFQVTRLTRKMVESYATIGACKPLFTLLAPEQQSNLEKYACDRGLIDLLHDYPGVLRDPADLVAILPRLAPRLYSISSSPSTHAGEIHTTVAVVRYRSHNRERGGVCSTLLADRRGAGESLPVYIQPNKRFRLPTDSNVPIIMIGPGTGVAPFRSFLHERRALGHKGKNWLFFGERSAATDFLYCDELESMHSDGHLTHLDLAFSRDQEHKIYVQDRMREQKQELFRWLQDGASVYVCGDASRMAKDVDTVLHEVVQSQGGLDADAATEYVQHLKDGHRYHRDVY
ncbi:MAG: sulfite reductase flavoprotein subunit alpha [Acidobacteria bacterium]|nr:sulfite reductase flavoprotein subunit alpha [Acidobacteriota bacterium]